MWTAAEATKILNRDLDASDLHVYWHTYMDCYVVAQKFRHGAMDELRDIYSVTNEDGSFRPLDRRTVHEVAMRDGRTVGRMKATEWWSRQKEAEEKRADKFRDDMSYKTRYYRRAFARWADENT